MWGGAETGTHHDTRKTFRRQKANAGGSQHVPLLPWHRTPNDLLVGSLCLHMYELIGFARGGETVDRVCLPWTRVALVSNVASWTQMFSWRSVDCDTFRPNLGGYFGPCLQQGALWPSTLGINKQEIEHNTRANTMIAGIFKDCTRAH